MNHKGTKGCATVLALSMALSPLTPTVQAYAEEASAEAPQDAIEVVADGAAGEAADTTVATDATDPVSLSGAEGIVDTKKVIDNPIDDEGMQAPIENEDDEDTSIGACRDNHAVHNVTQDTYSSTLEEAVEKARKGDTIQLNRDEVLDRPVMIKNKECTLDLAGHKITYTGCGVDYAHFEWIRPCAIGIDTSGALTIEDSSESQTGSIYNTSGDSKDAVVTSNGSLTIKGGTFYTDTSMAINQYGNYLKIDGGTFHGSTAAVCAEPGHSMVTVINDGTFEACHSVEGTSDFTINGGRFSDDRGNAQNYKHSDGKVLARKEGEEYYTLKKVTDAFDFDGVKYKPWAKLRGQVGMCINIENLPDGTKPEDYVIKCWHGDTDELAVTKRLSDGDGDGVELLFIAPMRMIEPIHMRVYCKNAPEAIAELDWTARDYFMALYNDKNQPEEVHHFAAAALHYGAAAQRYYVHRTDDLADAGIDEPMTDEAIPESFASKTYGRTEVAYDVTPSIAFENDTDLVLNMPLATGWGARLPVFRVDGVFVSQNGVTVDPVTGVVYSLKYHGPDNVDLRIAGIRPQYLDHKFKIDIGSQLAFDTTDNPSVGWGAVPYKTIEYAPMSYAYEKQNEYGFDVMCRAFYNYNLAAKQMIK